MLLATLLHLLLLRAYFVILGAGTDLSYLSEILGPSHLFSDNLLTPWMLPELTQGRIALPMPPDRPVQQITVQDIASFVALVLENPDRFLGKRIDIASDELTGRQEAEILSTVSGSQIEYVQVPIADAYKMNGDVAKMYEWFDAVGYSADIGTLRIDYPETGWHTFEEWAQAQDWSVLKGEGATSNGIRG